MDKKEENVLESAGYVRLSGRDTNIMVPASLLVRMQFRVPQTDLKLIQVTAKGLGFRGLESACESAGGKQVAGLALQNLKPESLKSKHASRCHVMLYAYPQEDLKSGSMK